MSGADASPSIICPGGAFAVAAAAAAARCPAMPSNL